MNVERFIHEAGPETLPDEVLHQARRCLLDTVGTAIAARGTRLSSIVHGFAVECHGGRGGILWQDGREVSPPGAALANAATVDALDCHDGHSLTKGHAGAAIVPAAFAVMRAGSDGPSSGSELLSSIAVGYEIALRAGIELHATAADYHTSGAWNALGCAAVTARRLGLSEQQTLHALGIAEYHGPRSPMMRCIDHPTMLKDGSGWGAMCGVSAGILAAKGFTGLPAETVDVRSESANWNDLGERWELLNLYFKPHAVCRWAQPAVEAALMLKSQFGFGPSEIARIAVETFHEATRLAVRTPTTTEEAQYSLPFSVAAALCHGRLGPEELIDVALSAPDIRRLAEMIELSESEECSAAFPSRRLASLTITLESGAVHRVNDVEPRWEAGCPPDDDELIAKFHQLTGSLSADRRDRLASLLLSCADLRDATAIAVELSEPT